MQVDQSVIHPIALELTLLRTQNEIQHIKESIVSANPHYASEAHVALDLWCVAIFMKKDSAVLFL